MRVHFQAERGTNGAQPVVRMRSRNGRHKNAEFSARTGQKFRESLMNPIALFMTSPITIERVETRETTIEVEASTPEEAFARVKLGQGHEIGSVEKSELLIRDYHDETLVPNAS